MGKKISDYERRQVDKFLYELYSIWGQNLDREECRNEGWMIYLDGRKKYKYDIGDAEYWDYVGKNVRKRLEQIRQNRNEKYRLESRMSLNCKYGEEKEEIGTIIPDKSGDFVNGIALWDYLKNLGEQKYRILRLMNAKEDDIDIMKRLYLTEEEYFSIKLELREDFQLYLDI